VENFTAFKKLMVKRNAELNQQALAMLQSKEAAKNANAPGEGGHNRNTNAGDH
jgi:hypothetical protein